MDSIRFLRICLFTVLAFAGFMPVTAQVVRGLSPTQADDLKAQIDVLSDQMRSSNWSSVYSLLDSSFAARWKSRRSFVREMEHGKSAFRGFGIAYLEAEAKATAIGGCILVIEGTEEVEYQGTFAATRDKSGQWKFTGLPKKSPYQIDGGSIACRKQKW